MPDGFIAEQIDNTAIHTFMNSSDAAVDAWAVALIEAIEPTAQPFRILMDVSAPQVSFTRHARQTSQRLFMQYRGRQGRIAFLFSSKTAPHFARLFFASLGKLQFELKFFSSRDKALDWLNE